VKINNIVITFHERILHKKRLFEQGLRGNLKRRATDQALIGGKVMILSLVIHLQLELLAFSTKSGQTLPSTL
jgi:hypothetical protein